MGKARRMDWCCWEGGESWRKGQWRSLRAAPGSARPAARQSSPEASAHSNQARKKIIRFLFASLPKEITCASPNQVLPQTQQLSYWTFRPMIASSGGHSGSYLFLDSISFLRRITSSTTRASRPDVQNRPRASSSECVIGLPITFRLVFRSSGTPVLSKKARIKS